MTSTRKINNEYKRKLQPYYVDINYYEKLAKQYMHTPNRAKNCYYDMLKILNECLENNDIPNERKEYAYFMITKASIMLAKINYDIEIENCADDFSTTEYYIQLASRMIDEFSSTFKVSNIIIYDISVMSDIELCLDSLIDDLSAQMKISETIIAKTNIQNQFNFFYREKNMEETIITVTEDMNVCPPRKSSFG